jgi:hypothetical protein
MHHMRGDRNSVVRTEVSEAMSWGNPHELEPKTDPERFRYLDDQIAREKAAHARNQKLRTAIDPAIEAHAAKMRERAELRKRFPWITNGKGHPNDLGRVHRLLVDIIGYDFRTRSNEPEYCRPRQVAMWLMREILGASYPAIARYYLKDSTTVLHSVRRVDAKRRTNAQAKHETDELLSEIQKTITATVSDTN